MAFIQRTVAGRAVLRIDGNQGYDRDTAARFAAALEPDGIELLEQPCAAGDWAAARAVAKASTVPTMLDESIYDLDDIERAAADRAARFIKLKLMKMGGLTRLVDGLARIGRHGMTAVLGNGVATDLGCWMEACVAARHVATAGEMTGFLKPRARLFKTPLTVRDFRRWAYSARLPPLTPQQAPQRLEGAGIEHVIGGQPATTCLIDPITQVV